MTQAQYFYNQAARRKSIYGDLGTYRVGIDQEPKPEEPKKVIKKRASRRIKTPKKVLLMIHIPTNTKLYSMREVCEFTNRNSPQVAMANVIKHRDEFKIVKFPKFFRARKIEHVETGKIYKNIYVAAWENNLGYYCIEKHIEQKTGKWRWVC